MVGNENITGDKLRTLIEERGQRVLATFRQEAVSGVTDPKLLEAVHFVCSYWKDNFRPAFASLCCEAVGGREETADDVSLMITLISAGGGIHDDIIDKSSNKHFRMTVLGKYGVDYALLIGDLLIQKGWALARNIVEKTQPKNLVGIIDAFRLWTLDVCEAEFMEIGCRRNLETEINHYENILRKSMADTQACARLGAVMGGGSESEIEALSEFGSHLGFMYRLSDDLKDTLNIEYNLADRLRHESVPLPVLYAAKKSKGKRTILEGILAKSSAGQLDLECLLEACIDGGALDYLCKRAEETVNEALKSVEPLRDSASKGTLAFMIKQVHAEILELYEQATSDYQHGLYS